MIREPNDYMIPVPPPPLTLLSLSLSLSLSLYLHEANPREHSHLVPIAQGGDI